MMSRKAEGLPLVVAMLAAIVIIYALRRGVFPVDWVSRSTQPIPFWLEVTARR